MYLYALDDLRGLTFLLRCLLRALRGFRMLFSSLRSSIHKSGRARKNNLDSTSNGGTYDWRSGDGIFGTCFLQRGIAVLMRQSFSMSRGWLGSGRPSSGRCKWSGNVSIFWWLCSLPDLVRSSFLREVIWGLFLFTGTGGALGSGRLELLKQHQSYSESARGKAISYASISSDARLILSYTSGQYGNDSAVSSSLQIMGLEPRFSFTAIYTGLTDSFPQQSHSHRFCWIVVFWNVKKKSESIGE